MPASSGAVSNSPPPTRPFAPALPAFTFQKTVPIPPPSQPSLTSPCGAGGGAAAAAAPASILTNFWTTQNFIFLCLYRPHNGNFFSIFQFLVVFGPNGPRAGWETWSFQYRTPRSRSVIPSPHSFSAENKFLKKSGNWILDFFEKIEISNNFWGN